MLSTKQLVLKRGFDLVLGFLCVLIFILPILGLVVLASLDTGKWGWFSQKRIGQNAKPFHVYKIRTLKAEPLVFGREAEQSSGFGSFLRRFHLDEWPQLINILKGDMSFVGPRPDLPGYADLLVGNDRLILRLKPGLTGPASLKYRDEENLLNTQENPEAYYREIIWPDKVKINKAYIQTYSFYLDLQILLKTVFHV